MKVAVSGATGFLGTYVLKELKKRNYDSVVATSRSTPPPQCLPDGALHVVCDLRSPSADLFERLGKPDVLIHLAWPGLPRYKSRAHYEESLAIQYEYLKGLVTSGLTRVVCAGTCFEYGMKSGELAEWCETNPTNPYGFAKDALRRQLQFLNLEIPFQLTWARLFYMYGIGQPEMSLYSQLRAAVARGDETFSMSPGDQLRDFLPVEVVSSNLVSLAARGEGGGVVNVCSGKPTSVRSQVESWLKEFGWRIELDLGRYTYPDYEPMAFWGSNMKLRQLLGDGTCG